MKHIPTLFLSKQTTSCTCWSSHTNLQLYGKRRKYTAFIIQNIKCQFKLKKTNSDPDYRCLRKQELNRSLIKPTFFLLKHSNINVSYKLDENEKNTENKNKLPQATLATSSIFLFMLPALTVLFSYLEL